jgi:hypothetical protein
MNNLRTQKFWVLIHAEFSKDIKEEIRDDIYERLENADWIKIHTSKINISTTWKCLWHGKLAFYVKKKAVEDFIKYISKGVKVKLVVHAGLTEPNVYELIKNNAHE